MKRKTLLSTVYLCSSLMSLAVVIACISPVAAEPQSLRSVANSLVYPRSSERFFREGRRQFDREIIRLQQGDSTPPSDLLNVSASIFEQQQQQQEQQEQQLQEKLESPQKLTLPDSSG